MLIRIIGFALIYIQVDRITDNQIVRIIALAYILSISLNTFMQTQKYFPYEKLSKLFLFFSVTIIFALFRTWSPVSTYVNILYSITSYIVYSFFILTSYIYLIIKQGLEWKQLITRTVIFPLAIFVSANLILWIFDIKISSYVVIDNTTSAVILSSVGIHIQRVIFPLSGGGLNTYGDMLGALLTISLVITWYKTNIVNIIIILITTISILLVDSRSFLIYALIAPCIIIIIRKTKFYTFFKNIPVILIIAPFILLILLPLIYSSVSTTIVRSDEANTLLRVLVWKKSLSFLSDFQIIHLIGFGEYGHFGSGASKQWASYFKYWKSPQYISPHNTLFSIIYDYGYFGLVIYFMLIRKSVNNAIKLWKNEGNRFLPVFIMSFWLYYLLSSSAETLNGFYSPGMIYLFQSVVIISELSKYKIDIFNNDRVLIYS